MCEVFMCILIVTFYARKIISPGCNYVPFVWVQVYKAVCGPMWSSEPTEQGSATVDNCRDQVKVCNIESS